MCYFITGCVSTGADLARLNEMVSRLGLDRRFRFTELKNPFAIPQLPENSSYCSMSRGHCDCDTAIGNGREPRKKNTPNKAKLKKLRARGWSDARIERWKNQRKSALDSRHRSAAPSNGEELENWWRLLTTVLKSDLSQHLGLLKHWYSTDVFSESFEFSTSKVSIKDLTTKYLSGLQEDTLYLFEQHAKNATRLTNPGTLGSKRP